MIEWVPLFQIICHETDAPLVLERENACHVHYFIPVCYSLVFFSSRIGNL